MLLKRRARFWAITLVLIPHTKGLSRVPPTTKKTFGSSSRRASLVSIATILLNPFEAAFASDEPTDTVGAINYNARDRKGNKQAAIREDYWYIFGKTPPQLLKGPLQGADPQWNAFGSCETSEATGTNSCTYVSLSQRIPSYSKYASSIKYGARDYERLGEILRSKSSLDDTLWNEAATYVLKEPGVPPPPAVDAELKMILLATAMLTSPNFPGPSRELLVARFYANEVRFAHQEILASIGDRDLSRALHAWDFGKDSWNSYFQTIDRQIVPKVGDKFAPIA